MASFVHVSALLIGCGTVGIMGYKWGYPHYIHQYRHHHRYYAQKKFGEEAVSMMIRDMDTNKLVANGNKIKLLKDYYEADDVKDRRSSVILNVGMKKQGKSFNSCIESLLLCEKGCHFPVGESARHCTVGIDISPPLPLSKHLNLDLINFDDCVDCDDIVIVDVEGFDSVIKNQAFIEGLAKIWAPITSIVVLSCINDIDEERGDVKLFNDIHRVMHANSHDKLKYIAAVAPTRKVDKNVGWKKVRAIEPNCSLKLLPMFGAYSTIGSRVKEDLQRIPYNNPIQYMESSQIEQYRAFAQDMRSNLLCSVEPSKIIEAINETLKLVKSVDE